MEPNKVKPQPVVVQDESGNDGPTRKRIRMAKDAFLEVGTQYAEVIDSLEKENAELRRKLETKEQNLRTVSQELQDSKARTARFLSLIEQIHSKICKVEDANRVWKDKVARLEGEACQREIDRKHEVDELTSKLNLLRLDLAAQKRNMRNDVIKAVNRLLAEEVTKIKGEEEATKIKEEED